MNALDATNPAKRTITRMRSNRNEQPRNRIRIGRIDSPHSFPGDFASIIQLPGRPSIMMADNRTPLVMELSLRSLQSPSKLTITPSLTNVNLRASRMHLQNNVLARRRFDCVGHIGPRNVLPARRDSHCNHQYELHEKFIHGEQCTTAAQRVGRTFLSASVDLRCMRRGRPRPRTSKCRRERPRSCNHEPK